MFFIVIFLGVLVKVEPVHDDCLKRLIVDLIRLVESRPKPFAKGASNSGFLCEIR